MWHARFFKTRTLATSQIGSGKVRLNSKLTKKPAASVGAGDVLTFAQGNTVRVVRILGIPERRGPASEAAEFFEDVVPKDAQ